MNKVILFFRTFLNFCLFLFYSLVAGIIIDFIYGFVLKIVLGEAVPGSYDPVHQKIALIAIGMTLIITLLCRKFFYLKLKLKYGQDKNNKTKIGKENIEKKVIIKNSKKENKN